MRTCRFCGVSSFDSAQPLIQYGVRHYAHAECFLRAKGVEGINALSLWQLGRLPYFLLKELGLLEAVNRRLEVER